MHAGDPYDAAEFESDTVDQLAACVQRRDVDRCTSLFVHLTGTIGAPGGWMVFAIAVLVALLALTPAAAVAQTVVGRDLVTTSVYYTHLTLPTTERV